MNIKSVNSILNFIAGCNEFINGKFLFASAKLQSLFDEIEYSPDLTSLFNECNQGFDYSLEMTKAFVKYPTKVGTFTRPEELDKFLALIFGVLKEIKVGSIDYNIFVNKYFSSDDKTPPTALFAKSIIVPLRDTVAKYFELDEKNKTRYDLEQIKEEEPVKEEPEEVLAEETEQEEKIDLEPIFKQITTLCLEMLNIVKVEKKVRYELKTDANFLLTEIISACEQKDIEKAYALIVGFKYIAKQLKGLRYQIEQLSVVLQELENL